MLSPWVFQPRHHSSAIVMNALSVGLKDGAVRYSPAHTCRYLFIEHPNEDLFGRRSRQARDPPSSIPSRVRNKYSCVHHEPSCHPVGYHLNRHPLRWHKIGASGAGWTGVDMAGLHHRPASKFDPTVLHPREGAGADSRS